MFDVFGFYKFIKISYLKKNQKILHNQLLNKNIRGTIIISNEGLNGTISGKFKDIEKWITKSLSITMRTPGHDEDLVCLLYTSDAADE